ncbi:CPBP family glutamic-type intramembrane protease [Rufibacter quisquiliarum]|uniref:CAAX prenyl protease 2/Lysostaphin resistance protein A-like domain-containing protein n=1 Tax=Rufibacter quisquiliarum TaxID=1549639 RepID=A0A839GQZ7_9BACT|nr:CPBP family glutamic-type intramembrane protease [Rufibacter quisquiliarum]MBA9077317.1 hypothetical protein [Rufibacter quisquiliarum]
MFDKAICRLSTWPTPFIIGFLFLIKFSVFVLLGLLLYAFGGRINFNTFEVSPYSVWRHAVIPALFETFFSQFLVLKYSPRIGLNRTQAIWLSAAIFALAHFQNPLYILYEFPIGIIYALGFLVLQERKAKPFLWIALLHFLWNLMMLVF